MFSGIKVLALGVGLVALAALLVTHLTFTLAVIGWLIALGGAILVLLDK